MLKSRFRHISARQSVKTRNQDYWIHWFTGKGDEWPLSPPPAPWPAEKGLQHHDLYIHRRGEKTRAWRYNSIGTQKEGQWDRLTVGGRTEVPGLAGERIFVVNKQGKPSFVLQGTVAKLYGDLGKK